MTLNPANSRGVTVGAAAGGILAGTYPNPTGACALLRHETAGAVDGGDFTTGAWRTRPLNVESFDLGSIVTLAANQFTLGAGSYLIQARAPAYRVGGHQAKLYNITTAADALIGSMCYVGPVAFVQTDSWVLGEVVIAGTTVFELRHQCEATEAGNGMGVVSANFGVVNVFAEVLIIRVA